MKQAMLRVVRTEGTAGKTALESKLPKKEPIRPSIAELVSAARMFVGSLGDYAKGDKTESAALSKCTGVALNGMVRLNGNIDVVEGSVDHLQPREKEVLKAALEVLTSPHLINDDAKIEKIKYLLARL
ncbi:hypothetical protein HYT84_01245 [Candidatus Micrarchaeota archaeon]|nr:hypothetical protein [Candidatus Micrarchaeota archaeon]